MGHKKKRRNKRKSCRSKAKHKTKKDADLAIVLMLKNKKTLHIRKLRSYYCDYCGYWHVGRSRKIMYHQFDQFK